MGANLQIVSFDEKINTKEKALKDLDKRAEQARYEYGHNGYTGTIAELNFRYISTVFQTWEDFETFLKEKDKGIGYLAQVKTFRETKPLLAARQAARDAGNEIWKAQREKKAPSVIKTLTARRDRAVAKVKKIEAAQIAKSTKARFIAGGWASE